MLRVKKDRKESVFILRIALNADAMEQQLKCVSSLACAQKSRCANHEYSTLWTKHFIWSLALWRAKEKYTHNSVLEGERRRKNKKNIQKKFFLFFD